MNLIEVNAMNDIVEKLAQINVNILRGRLERGGILKTIKLKQQHLHLIQKTLKKLREYNNG